MSPTEMFFWVFVIALGSTIGVLLGGGLLFWLRDRGLTVFNLFGTILMLCAAAMSLTVIGWLVWRIVSRLP